nr:unnamed protein product [Callosobruchus chinensis]
MAALGKGMDVLFQSNLEGQMKEVILKYLNDAGRCLASLSHNITHNRRKMLIPLLSKTVKEVADKTTPTKLLFGDNLRENIKTAKLLENEGKELKATYSTTPKKMYTLKKKGRGTNTYYGSIFVPSGKPESPGPSTCSSEGDVASKRASLTQTLPSRKGEIQPEEVEVNYAGRLKKFYKNWVEITNDRRLLEWIQGYSIPFTRHPNTIIYKL